jgi:hypothetical protein
LNKGERIVQRNLVTSLPLQTSLHRYLVTSIHRHFVTSLPRHIVASSHRRIVASSHRRIVTSSHRHIVASSHTVPGTTVLCMRNFAPGLSLGLHDVISSMHFKNSNSVGHHKQRPNRRTFDTMLPPVGLSTPLSRRFILFFRLSLVFLFYSGRSFCSIVKYLSSCPRRIAVSQRRHILSSSPKRSRSFVRHRPAIFASFL